MYSCFDSYHIESLIVFFELATKVSKSLNGLTRYIINNIFIAFFFINTDKIINFKGQSDLLKDIVKN